MVESTHSVYRPSQQRCRLHAVPTTAEPSRAALPSIRCIGGRHRRQLDHSVCTGGYLLPGSIF